MRCHMPGSARVNPRAAGGILRDVGRAAAVVAATDEVCSAVEFVTPLCPAQPVTVIAQSSTGVPRAENSARESSWLRCGRVRPPAMRVTATLPLVGRSHFSQQQRSHPSRCRDRSSLWAYASFDAPATNALISAPTQAARGPPLSARRPGSKWERS